MYALIIINENHIGIDVIDGADSIPSYPIAVSTSNYSMAYGDNGNPSVVNSATKRTVWDFVNMPVLVKDNTQTV